MIRTPSSFSLATTSSSSPLVTSGKHFHIYLAITFSSSPLDTSGKQYHLLLGHHVLLLATRHALFLLGHNFLPQVTSGKHCFSFSLATNKYLYFREGEEISISYIPSFLAMPMDKRELNLLKHYEFQCECQACLNKVLILKHILACVK